jgi:hypothetical protein
MAHLNGPFDPRTLTNVAEPRLLGTTITVHCPEAALKAGLIAEVQVSASQIPIRAGITPPPARAAGWRPLATGPTAADDDFLLCVDVHAVRAMRRLPLLRRGGWDTDSAWQMLLRDRIFPMVQSADSRKQRAGVVLWVLLGVMVLAVEERGAHISNAKLRQRLEQAYAGDYRGLLGSFCANHAAQVAADSKAGAARRLERAASGKLAPEVQHAVRQIRAGELSIGMTTLRNETMAVRGQAALTASQAMQFQPTFEFSQTDRDVITAFSPSVRHVVDREVLFEAVKGMRLTAAGGPNGIAAAHLTSVVLEDEGCVSGLVAVTQVLLDGKIDSETVGMLTASNLFALSKRSDPADLRPIACGDWLPRVVSRYVALVLKKPILTRLEPLQLGSSPCGTEAAYRSICTYMELHPGKAVILADLSKAFQHLSRSKIMSHFMGDPLLDPFVPFLRYLYLSDSDLLLNCGNELGVATLKSEEGTQQGNGASSLIFNEVTLAALKRIQAATDDAGNPLVDFMVAIVDDCTLICDVANVPKVIAIMKSEYGTVGNDLNLVKTKVLLINGQLPDNFAAPIESGGLGLKASNVIDSRTPAELRGARLLGAPIGTREFQQAWLTGPKCFGSFHSDLGLVRDKMGDNLQEALILIKSCICTRAGHLPRLMDPAAVYGHLQKFDTAAAGTIMEMLGCDYADLVTTGHAAVRQAFVKPALGGLGLPPTGATANAAHVASVLDTYRYLSKMHPDLGSYYTSLLQAGLVIATTGAPPTSPVGAAGHAFIMALHHIALESETNGKCMKIVARALRHQLGMPTEEEGTGEGADGGADEGAAGGVGTGTGADTDTDGDLAAAEALVDTTGRLRRLQYHLSQPIYGLLGATYTASIAGDPLRTAQHLSQRTLASARGTGFLASGWLTTAPWQQQIASADLRVALLLFLGLPDSFLATGIPCKCGELTFPIGSTAALQHISGCGRHCKTFAHDIFCRGPTGPLAAAITTMSNTALITWEKHGYPTSGKKMDMVAHGVPGYTGALAIDYTLTNPTNQSTLNNACLVPLYCANEEHDDKITKYQQLMPVGDVFVPFAVEIYGGTTRTVVDTLQRWAQIIAEGHGGAVQPAAILGLLRQSFSLALMYARVELYRRCIGNCIESDAAQRRQIARQSYLFRAVQRARRRAQVKHITTRSGARASGQGRSSSGRL